MGVRLRCHPNKENLPRQALYLSPCRSNVMLNEEEQTLRVFLITVELAAIAATLLPLSRSAIWWIRFFDFPRVQIALIAAVALAADLAFQTHAGLTAQFIRAALALCILYQAYNIRPYTILARKQVQPARTPRPESTLSLLLANVKRTTASRRGFGRSLSKPIQTSFSPSRRTPGGKGALLVLPHP